MLFSGGFSNLSLILLLGPFVFLALLASPRLIPHRYSSLLEVLLGGLRGVVSESLGSLRFLPFLFSLFLFLLSLNFLGLFPYVFAATAQVSLTFALSFSIVLGATLAGFTSSRLAFLTLLVPHGCPLLLSPFLVLIETVGYFSRPVSLGMRLAANLTAGHLLFTIVAGFSYTMASFFPLVVLVFISLLEVAVSFIQAYVFCLLTAIYLRDSLRSSALSAELLPST